MSFGNLWFRRGWRGIVLAGALATAGMGQGALSSVPAAPWSSAASGLIQRAFEGLDEGAPVVDVHTHIVGLGRGGTGCFVHPKMLSLKHPAKRVAAKLYLAASGAKDFDRFDAQYVERLVALARGFGRPVKFHILAMDRNHRPDGTPDLERTEFYVPNEYVVRLAETYPDVFVPVISVHPARPDALAELERWAARGVRRVKWLPNAQGIDPADPRWDPFYRRMRELGLSLLTHAGEEKAVGAAGAQALGNPLRLRRPLDAGLTVIVAHCASLGCNEDLDHPGRKASSYELFLRLMAEERYRGRLFGEISAMTQVNRLGTFRKLLQDPALQDRLLNGSDYPLPAMNLVVWTSQAVRQGLITRRERRALNEIYRVNPLLFDFVLKRTVKDPKRGQRLPGTLFQRGQ